MLTRRTKWPRLSLDDLVSARKRVLDRSQTVEEAAAQHGVSVPSLYWQWRQHGLMVGSGASHDTRRSTAHREAVRQEVIVYMREYPWMSAERIADAICADGEMRASERIVRSIITEIRAAACAAK